MSAPNEFHLEFQRYEAMCLAEADERSKVKFGGYTQREVSPGVWQLVKAAA